MTHSPKTQDPILDFLAEKFPGDPDPAKAFESLLRKRTLNHEDLLSAVKNWLEELVDEFKKQCNKKEGGERYICNLDTSHDRKSWRSVADKLIREGNESKPKFNYTNFHEKMTDLVRLRLVCNFLSDVYDFEKRMKNKFDVDTSINNFVRLDKSKDTIKLRPKERKSAHRSIKYLFKTKESPNVFLEFQIMTTFQVAWDQKDHSLIYERTRSNPDKVKEIFSDYEDELVYNMGGSIHVLDTLFDHIKKKLGR